MRSFSDKRNKLIRTSSSLSLNIPIPSTPTTKRRKIEKNNQKENKINSIVKTENTPAASSCIDSPSILFPPVKKSRYFTDLIVCMENLVQNAIERKGKQDIFNSTKTYIYGFETYIKSILTSGELPAIHGHLRQFYDSLSRNDKAEYDNDLMQLKLLLNLLQLSLYFSNITTNQAQEIVSYLSKVDIPQKEDLINLLTKYETKDKKYLPIKQDAALFIMLVRKQLGILSNEVIVYLKENKKVNETPSIDSDVEMDKIEIKPLF